MKTLSSAELTRALAAGLKDLRMPTIRASYQELADQARRESMSFERYLYELVEQERLQRHTNRIQRWLRQSRLPREKTLDTFDRGRLPVLINHHVSVLLEGGFLDRQENVLAIGPPGTGKTHLLCALGRELIFQRRRVIFYNCATLVQQLLRAKKELRLPQLLKRLSRFEALIIDDIGYVQHNREEMEVLFILLSERYEKGSVLLTTNLAFSQWERIFQNKETTTAVIDRLVHHSVILEMNLPSYRLEVSQQRQQKAHEALNADASAPHNGQNPPPEAYAGADAR